MSLSYEDKKMIIQNTQMKLDDTPDPLSKEYLKGFIAGVWCCIDD